MREEEPRSTIGRVGDGRIALETEGLRLLIDPALGGKVCSLRSRQTGREFFFQDRHVEPSGERYVAHDMSGMDECFPTVAASSVRLGAEDVSYGDHGLLWSRPWQARIEGGAVRMWVDVPEVQARFERCCRAEGENRIVFEYRLSHGLAHALPFVYSAHPLLAGGRESELLLPESADRVFIEAVAGAPELEAKRWDTREAVRRHVCERGFDAARNSYVKAFLPDVDEGRVGLRAGSSGETLWIEFDRQALPQMGIFVFEGYGESAAAPYRDEVFFGLEPTTGIGDGIETARATGTLRELAPGETFTFWIALRVEA